MTLGAETIWTAAIMDWVPPSLSNQGGKLREKIRQKGVAMVLTAWAVRDRGWPVQTDAGPKMHLTITMYRARMLDPDNAYAAVKHVVDALKGAKTGTGWLWDDSTRYLELRVEQRSSSRKAQWTLLELRQAS